MNTHSAWCQQMFAMLAEGGVWGVPRSGLVFTKRNGKLVLTKRLPGIVPPVIQQDDYDEIREQFGIAGIIVMEAENGN